jgi:hypothetical protein
MGFEKFYPKFREVKCATLAEMIDPNTTTDALLSAGIGFSSIQIHVFRLECMNHQNGDLEQEHGGGGEDDEPPPEEEEEEDESLPEVKQRRKTQLLEFAAFAFEEAAKPTVSVGKSKWQILRKRITEAKDKMIAKSVAERAEMRRATKAADDLSKMFKSMNFSIPRDPPPDPSPIRVRALSFSEVDLSSMKRPKFVTNDMKARSDAMERAEKRSELIKPARLIVNVQVPAGETGGFVWTDGGFLIHINKKGYVQRSGRVLPGWRLGGINGTPLPTNATYILVKTRLKAAQDTQKTYTLTFEPPDKKGAKKLSDLGTAV